LFGSAAGVIAVDARRQAVHDETSHENPQNVFIFGIENRVFNSSVTWTAHGRRERAILKDNRLHASI